jgi:2-polyprenyl-6-methoxyphenol hydroxylase-like FAD-dependent oxidoreductase
MTPNLGQGAAMAIEDAWTLPSVIEDADPAAALARKRSGRVGPLARISRWLGWMAHWRSPVLRAVRDELMARAPASAARRPLAGLLLGGPVTPA